ncbi:Hypothetical protein DEACI_0968 [Acididesulfobacillus acetoxydans]|uniref:Uncharacterized protein n=1 Tax=Acididesulfobacillus acetoxydans TaxID=1561005 RepID=A0A8S0Y247_9FIRM|nr:hypothetical protein [Acididesulfobacillus acetoxydans]CAA7600315.1 Hypothetical protein DEACI_0968 [Acididesulfobacillus acetoxydans]CEJ06091.1 Hypothetical protein DEACI_0537 [Acididesulfobacillus acetoxydans]
MSETDTPGTVNEEGKDPLAEEDAIPAMQWCEPAPAGFDWIRYTKVTLTLVSLIILLVLATVIVGLQSWNPGPLAGWMQRLISFRLLK